MSWKFWKKEDSLPDYSAKGMGLGTPLALGGGSGGAGGFGGGSTAGTFPTGLGGESHGLDLSGQFEPASGLPNLGQGGGGLGGSSFSSAYPPPQSYDAHEPQGGASERAPAIQKDLDLIVAKLDAIKAQLETLNARLSTLEQRAPTQAGEPATNPRRPWY